MRKFDIKSREIKEVAREVRGALEDLYGEGEAGAMAWIVLEHVTGSRRGQLMTRAKDVLPAGQMDALVKILDELLAGKPLQYVLGVTQFYGLTLSVNPSVLIPRQETEELVDWIIRSAVGSTSAVDPASKREIEEPPDVLDIGTGSGCIAIALEKGLRGKHSKPGIAKPRGESKLSGARVWACDISASALELAGENARINQAEVRFKQADILDEHTWGSFPAFDIIVSNPPYVTEAERALMAANVLDHEPPLALFVKNEDPLRFYRKITAFAKQKLRPGGALYFEINEAFGSQMLNLLVESGFSHNELRKDLNGKDRMVRATVG